MSSDNKFQQNVSAYGSIASQQIQSFYVDQVVPLLGKGKAAFADFKQQADEGHWSWKYLGFVAGAAITVYAVLGLMSSIFLFFIFPATVLINSYLLVFGIIACLLEFKDVASLPYAPQLIEYIKKEALFLYRPYGRAFFYLFVGLFIWANGGVIGWVLGLYTSIVGLYIFWVSRDAMNKLNAFKQAVSDETSLRNRFKQLDTNHDNQLDKVEFLQLCLSLGLQAREAESAFLLINKNQDEVVTCEEFVAWWKGDDV
jgi:hypothetical protein